MSQAVKVGIFATVALVVLAVLILRVEDFNPFAPEGRRLTAMFDSVAGLDDRSAVRVAGVRVGRVDGVGLENRRARVGLLLEEPIGLTEGTSARIANLGLLGDKYVELIPGPPDAPPLPEDAVIEGITSPTFDDTMKQLSRIGGSIQRVTDSFGAEGGGESLGRLIQNLEATTAEIRELVAANRAQVDSTVANFERVSAALARELPVLTEKTGALVDQIHAVVSENREQLAGSMENVEELTADLRTSAQDLNVISGKLARGEGTLGKLLNDDQAHDELVATLDSIQGGVSTLSDTLGRVGRLRLDLGAEGAWLQDREESLASFGITIDPDPEDNKLYRVALSSTPGGDVQEKTVRETVTLPDGSTETTIRETFTREDKAVFTGLLGVRLDNGARLWGGIIEEDFGVQVDYPFFDRRAWLGLQAFDFDRENDRDFHLRLNARWYLHPNVYLWGGYDDPLESELDALFLGGGITWNDDNLKYLLGSVPSGAF
jgi:phospholipid/cholesterol/gamma-HCH transport system substrate-binding protein